MPETDSANCPPHARRRRRPLAASCAAWPWRPATGVFLFALAVRALYLIQSVDNPSFDTPVIDASRYYELARGLAAGEAPSSDLFWQPAGYPIWLSLLIRALGESVARLKVLQCLVGSVTCVLTGQLGARTLGRHGWWAGALLAAYGPAVFYDGELLAAGLASLVGVVLLLLYPPRAAQVDRRPWLRGAAFGAALGLAILVRPVFIPVALLLTGALVTRKRESSRKKLPLLAGMLLAALVVLGPHWALRAHVTGHGGLLPLSSGLNWYLGNGADRCEKLAVRPGPGWRALVGRPASEGIQGPRAEDAYFRRASLAQLQAEPRAYLVALGNKALEVTSGHEPMRNVDVYVARDFSPLLQLLVFRLGPFAFPFGLLAPFAWAGLWSLRRQPAATPLLLYSVGFAAALVMVFVTARYRLPWVPVLCVGAVAGARSAWLSARQRTGTGGLLLLGLGALVGLHRSDCPEPRSSAAELWLAVGHEQQARAPEVAERMFERAAALAPDYSAPARALYELALKRQDLDAALAALSRYLQLEPKDFLAQRLAGALYEKSGDVPAARAAYRKALALDPSDRTTRARLQALAHGSSPP